MPEERHQEVRVKGMFPTTLDLDPKFVPRLWVNNLFQRTLSLLTGWTGNAQVLIKATSAGALHTADTGSGFEEYAIETDVAPNAYSASYQLEEANRPSRWDLYIEDNDATIRFRNKTDTGWLGDINLPVGTYSLDFTSKTIQIKNRISGQICKYQIVGYW